MRSLRKQCRSGGSGIDFGMQLHSMYCMASIFIEQNTNVCNLISSTIILANWPNILTYLSAALPVVK